MCPWKAALAGTLPVLALLLIGISYTGWREHQAKERELEKRKKESHERDQMKSEKEMALNVKGNLGQQGRSEVCAKAGHTLYRAGEEIKGCQRTQGKHRAPRIP